MIDLVEVRSGGTHSLHENAGKSFKLLHNRLPECWHSDKSCNCLLTFYVDKSLHEIQIGALPADTEVPKGLSFPCHIKDYEIERLQHGSTMLQMFGSLTDPRQQRAKIEVRSQGCGKTDQLLGLAVLDPSRPANSHECLALAAVDLSSIPSLGLTADDRSVYLRRMSDKWHVTCFEHNGKVQVLGWSSKQTVDWAIQCFCQDVRQNDLSSDRPSGAG